MKNQGKAYLYGIATVLLWSTVASAFKLSLRLLDPLLLLLYASVVSILALGSVLAVQGRMRLLLTCSLRQYGRSLVLGFLNPFLYYVVLFKAYDLLPAQEAQPLNYTWAITLALLSIPLLGQRITRADLAACLVSYSGVVVIATRGEPFSFSFSDPWGVALALLSTVIWALYWIYNTRDDRDPAVGLLLNFLFGMPFILVACAAFSDFRVPGILGLAGAAYVGAFEMGFTFLLWLSALRLAENTARVGNLIFLSPFLSLVFIHLFVGEDIIPSTLVGLVLIIAGLLVQQLGMRRAPRPGLGGHP